MKCGECDNIPKCAHVEETDDVAGCPMFYPNVYMITNHNEEWNKYIDELNNK